MVKICSNNYPNENELKYKTFFDKYPFNLSAFQKYAIEAIVEEQHVLVTAHTGSGKTLPAEFAIEYFISRGKKVIYTSPIKALSNQKFYEFSRKFPHISFGILTGDIKTNPQANVLIMTAEILLNKLYQVKSNITNINNNSFDMDLYNELGCVIMDEVHYINDKERGKVWEETIMMLPKHIQMVMLSATLDSPNIFASWCENRQNNNNDKTEKIVYLTTTTERVVPLIHYSYITCNQGLFKILKDKKLEEFVIKTTNKLHIIQDEKGKFIEENYLKVRKTIDIFNKKEQFVKRQHVLNSITKYMVEHNMLPALCFVLSRKSIEKCAIEVQTPLFEDDSKIPYIIEHECEQIIRKLPNYEEYLRLPEYINLISLLQKGIAIHHSGIMPVLREMVELLFSKGYIKLLFATETFAVGLNMPTKTVLFCDINKFDGSNMRLLHSHEYTQMAGRAGRRGLDNIGHVIHLTNLFKDCDVTSMRNILRGTPQKLISKFKISYNLLLNLINICEFNFSKYITQSMIQRDINNEINIYKNDEKNLLVEIQNIEITLDCLKTPRTIIEKYIQLRNDIQYLTNKKKKETQREIDNLLDTFINIESDSKYLLNYNNKKNELIKIQQEIKDTENILNNNIVSVLEILETNNFISKNNNIDNEDTNIKYKLTQKGNIASCLREIHCLVFSDLVILNKLNNLTSYEIIGLLSCFTNISVADEIKNIKPKSKYNNINSILLEISDMYNNYLNIEIKQQINTGIDYNIHYELIDYIIEWGYSNNEEECKIILQKMEIEKEIYLGEFVKAILKINNICNELEVILENIGNIELLHKIKEIPLLTLKYVATNQSLYI